MRLSEDLVMLVQVEEAHETRFIRAKVWRVDPDKASGDNFLRIDSFTYGETAVTQFNGFTISAYLGQISYSGSEVGDPGEVWGWGHYFAPDRFSRPEEARSYASVLARVEKGLARIDGEMGPPNDYAGYVARIAHVLRLPMYVRNTTRAFDMRGESYTKRDASALAYWLTEVQELARAGQTDRIRMTGSTTDRV